MDLPSTIIVALISAAATLGAAFLTYLTARKLKVIGADKPQLQLNQIYVELNKAFEARQEQIKTELAECKERATQILVENDGLRREIRGLERELDELYNQVERHTKGKVRRPVRIDDLDRDID